MGRKQKFFLNIIMFVLVFVLFSTFFYSIYAKMIDKSSYTDWISAFCNVVMAGATVAAVLTARNYLAQFTAQEGYKLAIELVNDEMPKLKFLEFDIIKDKITHFEQLKEGLFKDNTTSDALMVMTGQIKFLQSRKDKLQQYYEMLNVYLYKVNTYGLIPVDSMSGLINSLADNFTVMLQSLGECIAVMQEIHEIALSLESFGWIDVRDIEKIKKRDVLYSSFLSRNLNEQIPTFFSGIKNIEVDYDEFMTKGHPITKLFIVK